MKVSRGLGVVVCPVGVEFLGRDAFLAIVKELDVIHALEILSTCPLVCERATFFRSCWFRGVVCSRLDAGSGRGQGKNRE
jgi:hypothetical protein